jgi:hypothetical protein
MDRVEFYIGGWKFAEATASRDHTVFFANQTFKSAADLYEKCLDIINPDLDEQLETIRALMRESKGTPVIPEVTEV